MKILVLGGAGVRDYIHVVDLAKGHISALKKLGKEEQGLYIYKMIKKLYNKYRFFISQPKYNHTRLVESN